MFVQNGAHNAPGREMLHADKTYLALRLCWCWSLVRTFRCKNKNVNINNMKTQNDRFRGHSTRFNRETCVRYNGVLWSAQYPARCVCVCVCDVALVHCTEPDAQRARTREVARRQRHATHRSRRCLHRGNVLILQNKIEIFR